MNDMNALLFSKTHTVPYRRPRGSFIHRPFIELL